MAKNFFTHAFADNIRLAKSRTLIAPAVDTYNLIRLPKRAFLKQVWLYVKTATTAGGTTMTIGFVGNEEAADPDAFLTDTECDPQTAGMKTSLGGSAAWAAGKYFDKGGGMITLTVGSANATAFEGIVFASYVVIY